MAVSFHQDAIKNALLREPTGGERTHHRGKVAEVIGARTGSVLRYRVTFPDGTSGSFFGFELERTES